MFVMPNLTLRESSLVPPRCSFTHNRRHFHRVSLFRAIHLQLIDLRELSQKSCLSINTYLLDGSERMRAILATKQRTVSPGELFWRESPVPLPLCYDRNILVQDLLPQWKSEWDSANTAHELLPDPSLKHHKWSRFEIMFVSEYGPSATSLPRFHLRSTDVCSCGEMGSPIHFATSRPLTSSCHFSPLSSANLLLWKPAGVFSPKLSRILPQKGAVSPSPARLKKFESIITQNPMTTRRFFIIVIEKYLGKEWNSKRCVTIFLSYRLRDKLT
ncbi:hypothetical protein AVEN_211978-1 [Araneus ventricosus]|uniref:Uncharacterized protein n=1 Tax=Araneus ventricosus TaxID=182803 RepID=A0A4Y2VVT8_ARAVE|nr:hypothetical protein AVEN_211978-1 [Araneus ventricosus]